MYLPGEDLNMMLAGRQKGLDDGAADVAGATCDCDDDHDEW